MLEMNHTKKVAIHTLGCRLNFAESGSISRGFRQRGYQIVKLGVPADLTLINTCTVTDSADSSCRHLIRKAHRISPEGKIVVVGCYAQMDAPRIAKMQGVELVLGTAEKHKVFQYLEEEERDRIRIDRSQDFCSATMSTAEGGHTRAFLKIQDGCNYVCSFCIIPQARGRSRAISIPEAVEQMELAISEGFKEVVLTGVNIGEYNSSGEDSLYDLVAALVKVKGLRRLRLSSMEPNTIDDKLLDLLADNSVFMPHFHIPMQSGDDEILGKMKRKYTTLEYERVIEKISKRFPDSSIGADVICGFPGEGDGQFNNTYKLLEDLPITHFHVFPYSKRKNTVAAKMEEQIQHGIKKERVKALMELGNSKLAKLALAQVGSVNEVLFENSSSAGWWNGYTTNFIRTNVRSDGPLKNEICKINITDSKDGELYGSIISEHG